MSSPAASHAVNLTRMTGVESELNPGERSMQRVLLVTDGSFNALRAARTAADIVHRAQGEVVILYIIAPVPILAKNTVSQGNAQLNDIVSALRGAMQAGQAALAQSANLLIQAGIRYTARLEQGVPAVLICQIAQREHCDAIVIGSGGLDRTTALALGTVNTRRDGCTSRAVIIVS